MHATRTLGLTAGLLLLCAAAAPAQSVPYHEDFESGTNGWSLHGLWSVDGDPASAPGGAASSGRASLNFNDGTAYPGLQRAACQSPTIRASRLVDHVLRFRCNYETETTGTRYDRRFVIVRVNGQTVVRQQLSGSRNAPRGAHCSAMGMWHTHTVRIPAPRNTRSFFIQVEFVFDSVDALYNDFAGWFIDDVEVAPVVPNAPAFDLLTRSTLDFRDLATTISIDAGGQVEIARSQPNVRFPLVQGRATAAELRRLQDAVQRARLASIPNRIPDPNTYVVRPTSFRLEVRSQIPDNRNTIEGNLGVYGRWDAQLRPVMDAVDEIEQRLLGSGGSASGDDHGDTPQAATDLLVDPGTPVAGTIDPPGDVDWFKLVDNTPVIMIYIYPPPQRTYIFETAVSGSMDTVIELYGPDGQTLIATNDDAPGLGLGSRVSFTTQHGQTLYVKVRHYDPAGTGSYTIRVRTAAAPNPGIGNDDHGNTQANATTIEVGDPPTPGTIDPPGDVDMFRFSEVAIAIYPPPQVTYVIEAKPQPGMDTVIELYKADGTLLAVNDDAPGLGLGSRIVYTGPAGQAYFVKVRHYDPNGTGDYTIEVRHPNP
ncbi:MAG: hypothetical protein D6776_02155 [Planctomycetota bacterium]|nr:MAG: hypothetical protein D6776_02155 [Planctomycetota bacterium]